MAYTPTTWNRGDTVTSTKLNKLEQGVANAGGPLICNCTDNGSNITLDKTVQEIYDALSLGTPTYLRWIYGVVTNPNSDYVAHQWLCPVTTVYRYSTDTYRVAAIRSSNNQGNYDQMGMQILTFSASSLSAYPVFLNFLDYPENQLT